MKNITCLLLLIFLGQTISAQVTISGAHASSNGDYTTLQNAFTAINANDQTGKTIAVEITSSFTDNNTATLNSGNWNSLSIYPTADNITISGSLASGSLINLSGVQDVVLDGRVNQTGSTKSMVIENTSNSNTTGTSTIQLINGVSDTEINYCIIKGSATNDYNGNNDNGILYISTGGNNNIDITNNDFTKSGSNRPRNGILSLGTNGNPNTSLNISHNHFYDLLPGNGNFYVHFANIYLDNYTTASNISNNHFYQTEAQPLYSYSHYHFIYIDAPNGYGFTIEDNYMGGQAPSCGGGYYTTSGDHWYYFRPMELNTSQSGLSEVQGNLITNFDLYYKGSQCHFTGAWINGGDWDVGTEDENIIGSKTGNTAIKLTNTSTSSSDYLTVTGFWGSSNFTGEIANNSFGGFTINSSGAYISLYGLWHQGGTLSVKDNLFGSTDSGTSSSILFNSASANFYCIGITLRGGSSHVISGNTISKIKSNSTTSAGYLIGIENLRSGTHVYDNVIKDLITSSASTGTGTSSALIGLSMRQSTYAYDNEISNLSNINDTFEGQLVGVYKTGFSASTLNRNFIHDLSLTGTNVTNAKVYGCLSESWSMNTNNNVIVLGNNNTNYLYGIYDNCSGGGCYHYFNTIYLEGTPPVGSSPSYCYYSNNSTPQVRLKNNILYNNRSTAGGSNIHYAAGFNYGTTTSKTLDYNNYYAPGTGGVLGYFNSTNQTSTPIITGQDANSYSQDPLFLNEGSSNSSDYFPTNSLWGEHGTGITDDFASNDRNNPPYIGAFEVIPEVTWTGATSTDWNTTSNWNPNILPADGTNAIIPNVSVKPVINNGVAGVSKILTINSGSNLTINPGGSLTIHEEIANSGTINLESNASGDASLIVEGTLSGSGTYNVQRFLSGSQWHLVTSPITNGVAGVFQDIWLRAYDEATNSFDEYIVPYTTPMPTGQGFSVWADAAETRTFTGIINHGAVGPLSAQLTGAAGANTGWNLMGNPYPSAIDWDASSGWTKSNLANSVYVWNSTQYATYIGGTGANGGSRYIAPGQGFFVQATSAGASLSMNSDVQVHNSVNFLKNSQSDSDNTIRVTISADGYQDENVIVIREANANSFDPQVDAYKLPGSADAPQMHIEKDDFSELSIASFPQIQDIENKALNIDYALEGTHTLLWSHTCTENTPALLDQQTGQIIEPGSNHTFTASFSDMQDRFVFTTDLLSIQDKINELDVWEYNNTLFIKSNTNENQISVFNMQGVKVYSNTGNEFNLNHLASAMYLVKIKSGENHKIQKIVIK